MIYDVIFRRIIDLLPVLPEINLELVTTDYLRRRPDWRDVYVIVQEVITKETTIAPSESDNLDEAKCILTNAERKATRQDPTVDSTYSSCGDMGNDRTKIINDSSVRNFITTKGHELRVLKEGQISHITAVALPAKFDTCCVM